MRGEPIDISCPISSGMWAYRDDWRNQITRIAATADGDASTVYRFNLCSHTGTYIETSQHKLPTDLVLDDYPLDSFVRPCVVVCLREKDPGQAISRAEVETQLRPFSIEPGDAVIVATGWGRKCGDEDYIQSCPYFDQQLTAYIAGLQLGLFGVDVPVIDNPIKPYQAIAKLFQATPRLLVLAPLVVDLGVVQTGRYTLSALPLKIPGVCASLCRPMLFKL